MPVTADIEVGKRTVLTYLLGRVMPLAKEGMREPRPPSLGLPLGALALRVYGS
jgi:hypothetical protein